MREFDNGVPATDIEGAVWRKSGRSNPSGNCVELAALPGGASRCATPATRADLRSSTRARRSRPSSAA